MDLGKVGEQVAARYLKHKGHTILAMNYRRRIGEIDIVSCDGEVIVFCEVKTRRTDSKGKPFESVTLHKQAKIKQLAQLFMLAEFGELRTCRFDVCSLRRNGRGEIDVLHLENAFW